MSGDSEEIGDAYEEDGLVTRESFYADDDPHAVPPVGLFQFATQRHAQYWELVYLINNVLDPLDDEGKIRECARKKTKDYYWGAAAYVNRDFLAYPLDDPNDDQLAGAVIAASADGKSRDHLKRWTGWSDDVLDRLVGEVERNDLGPREAGP